MLAVTTTSTRTLEMRNANDYYVDDVLLRKERTVCERKGSRACANQRFPTRVSYETNKKIICSLRTIRNRKKEDVDMAIRKGSGDVSNLAL